MPPTTAPSLVPPPDPFGLPAPAWLLVLLLNLTFVIHLLFMNLALAGAVAQAVVVCWPRRTEAGDALLRVLRIMWAVGLSFTITTGIAPLLFVQVLYGQWFYPANVMMGAAWLSVILLLIVAFYGAYAFQAVLKSGQRPATLGKALAVLVAICVLMIAFVLTANNLLTVQPQRWWNVHTGQQAAYSPLAPGFVPRYLQNVSQAGWVMALWIAWTIRWRRDLSRDESDGLHRLACVVGVACTVAGVVAASWSYFSQVGVLHDMGRTTSTIGMAAWWISIAACAATGFSLFRVMQSGASRRGLQIASALGLLSVSGMVAGREGFRLAALAAPAADDGVTRTINAHAVHPQYGAMMVFFPLLLGGLGLVVLMVQWYRRGDGRAAR